MVGLLGYLAIYAISRNAIVTEISRISRQTFR